MTAPSRKDERAALEHELRELRTVNELIRTLTSTLELPEILRIVLDRLKSLTQAEALSLMLYDAERDELVFAATETLRENAAVGLRLPPSRSLAIAYLAAVIPRARLGRLRIAGHRAERATGDRSARRG